MNITISLKSVIPSVSLRHYGSVYQQQTAIKHGIILKTRTLIQCLVGIISLCITIDILPAETISYGGKDNWDNAVTDGLSTTTGWQNGDALTILPKHRNPFSVPGMNTDNVDILLLSEPDGIVNPGARYSFEGDTIQSNQTFVRGQTAIWPLSKGLKLYPSGNAMFAPGKKWGDFTLGLYLCPKRLEDGDTLFFWEGKDSLIGMQKITASFHNRRLVWKFQGFFQGNNNRTLNLTLTSAPLIPGEWRYHQIIFSANGTNSAPSGASPGLLEYRLDGISVDAVHASINGRENRLIFLPRIGNLSDKALQLAPNFVGWLDEFKLVAASAPVHYLSKQNIIRGVGRMPPLDTGFVGSEILSVRARVHIPGTSRIRFFIKSFNQNVNSNNIGLPELNSSLWEEIFMQAQTKDQMGISRWFTGIPVKPIRTRYFTIGFILESDSVTEESPVLSVIKVEYRPKYPPEPPGELKIVSGKNDAPAITWSLHTEVGVAGWWIFWGPNPGDYFSGQAEDSRYGLAWIPRNIDSTESPGFQWPLSMVNTRICTSIRAAWPESGPDATFPPKPLNYRGLSKPSRELVIYP